jgi:hypothetical protein
MLLSRWLSTCSVNALSASGSVTPACRSVPSSRVVDAIIFGFTRSKIAPRSISRPPPAFGADVAPESAFVSVTPVRNTPSRLSEALSDATFSAVCTPRIALPFAVTP